MIIFDLDGTLANCEHRRHLVDAKKNPSYCYTSTTVLTCMPPIDGPKSWINSIGQEFKPDWDAFHEACDKDTPNKAIVSLFRGLYLLDYPLQIWSGRSESVRNKTITWYENYILPPESINPHIDGVKFKFRPIGDSTPDDVLKERWLDEALAEGKQIDMVFDDRDKVVAMWRRRGITCLQVAEGDF